MSHSSQIKLLFLLFLSIIVSCSTLSQNVFQGKGLVTGQPAMNTFHARPPGETINLKRPFTGAPPLVPHDIVELEINRSANDCLECHYAGLEEEHGEHLTTKVPPSHYINEYSKEQTKEQVVGIRYLCLQCHVPQSEEEPPVSQK